mgnify:CR=1 FL=1
MYPINAEDTLTRVTRYDLSRGDCTLTIEVFFELAGPNPGRWQACPLHKSGAFHVSAALWGEGDSEAAALRDCLGKIRHLPIPDIHAHP